MVLPLATMCKKKINIYIYIVLIGIFWVHSIPNNNSLQWGMAIGNAVKQKPDINLGAH
jgi:hypothetical protein